jgi:hypothetical protein
MKSGSVPYGHELPALENDRRTRDRSPVEPSGQPAEDFSAHLAGEFAGAPRTNAALHRAAGGSERGETVAVGASSSEAHAAKPIVSSGAAPTAVPGAAPNIVPGAAPTAVPGAAPNIVPGAAPSAVSGAAPKGDNQIAHGPGMARAGVPAAVEQTQAPRDDRARVATSIAPAPPIAPAPSFSRTNLSAGAGASPSPASSAGRPSPAPGPTAGSPPSVAPPRAKDPVPSVTSTSPSKRSIGTRALSDKGAHTADDVSPAAKPPVLSPAALPPVMAAAVPAAHSQPSPAAAHGQSPPPLAAAHAQASSSPAAAHVQASPAAAHAQASPAAAHAQASPAAAHAQGSPAAAHAQAVPATAHRGARAATPSRAGGSAPLAAAASPVGHQRPAFLKHTVAHASNTGPAARAGSERAWSPRLPDASDAKAEARADAKVDGKADVKSGSPAGLTLTGLVGPTGLPLHASPAAHAPSADALAAPSVPEATALWTEAALDPSLRATVMPENAVLSFDTGAGGEAAVHLHVKDGVADVRIDGAGADALAMHPQDLRTALAGEGLTLGSFESGQPAPHQAPVEMTDEPVVSPARAAAAPTSADGAESSSSSPLTPTAGRGVHVTA